MVFWQRIFPILLLLLLSSCGDTPSKGGPDPTPVKLELIFADASDVWWTAPTIVAQTHDCFTKHNLSVKSFNVNSGLESKNAVVQGNAEIGLVAATPLAMGAYTNEKLVVLCSYVESNALLAVLKKKDPAAAIGAFGQPVALVPRTISEWYWVSFLKKHHPEMQRTSIEELHVKPPDVPNAFRTNAKTAVIWEPFATLAAQGVDTEVVRDPELYTLRLFLITRPEVLEKKRAAVDAFLAGLTDACAQMKESPDAARRELETKYKYQDGSLTELWNKVEFSVKYDFDTMKTLIMVDAKIALELGYTPRKELPDLDRLFVRNK